MKKRRIYRCAPHCIEPIGGPEVPPSSSRARSARAPLELPPGAEVAPEKLIRFAIHSELRASLVTLQKAQWTTITDSRSADKHVCYVCGAVCIPEFRQHYRDCKLRQLINQAESLFADLEEAPLRAPGPESEIPAMPPHPPDDGAARPKWNSKWEFDRAGERVQIVVVAYGPTGQEETIDAREFIERLGETHQVTTFAIHVETEQKDPE